MSLVAGACVLSEPPDYGIARQSPPFFWNLLKADPSIWVVKPYSSNGPPQNVSVPVRSEDAGDPLVGIMFLDYKKLDSDGGEIPNQIGSGYLPAGTFDETDRVMKAFWVVPPKKGCHTVTLVVTHSKNLDGNVPINDADTAIISWPVDIDDDGTSLVGDCPGGGS